MGVDLMGNVLGDVFGFIAPKTKDIITGKTAKDAAKKRQSRPSAKGNLKKALEYTAEDTMDLFKGAGSAGVEAASLIAPVGRGAKFLVSEPLRGAASAAAHTEASNPLEFIGDVAKGAVGGAVGGGIVKGLGAGISKLAKNTMNNAFREPKRDMVSSIKKAGKQLGEEVMGDKSLAKGLTENQIRENAISRMSQLEEKLQETLKNSGKTIPFAKIVEKLQPRISELKRNNFIAEAGDITNRLKNWFDLYGDEIPVTIANQDKRILYDKVNKAWGTQSAPGTEDLKKTAKVLKELIAEKVPEAGRINEILGKSGRVAQAMTERMASKKSFNILDLGVMSGPVGAGLATGNLPLAVGGVAAPLALKAWQSAAGQKLSAETMEILSKVVSNPVTDRAGSLIGGGVGPEVIDNITNNINDDAQAEGIQNDPASNQQNVNQDIQSDSSIPDASGNVNNPDEEVRIRNKKTGEVRTIKRSEAGGFKGLESPSEQPKTVTGLTLEQLGKAMTMATLDGNSKAATQIKQLYEIEKEFQKEQSPDKKGKMTAGQLKELSELENSADQLTIAEEMVGQYKGKMGPAQGLIGSANKYDVDAQDFQAGMEAIAQQVGKAMEGGVLRAEDVPKYKKMLPQITDLPEVASRKINRVRKLLQDKHDTKYKTYSENEVAGGDEVEPEDFFNFPQQ
jgi:hypothetical protein